MHACMHVHGFVYEGKFQKQHAQILRDVCFHDFGARICMYTCMHALWILRDVRFHDFGASICMYTCMHRF